MELKDITPKALKCIIASCPAIYEADDGSIVVVGRRLDSATVSDLLPGKVAPYEEAIIVPRELLSEIPGSSGF